MRLNIFIWIVLLFLGPPFQNLAQTSIWTNRPTRSITLEESIRLALQHNLSIQVARYDPTIIQYDLNATYGGYDPVFSAGASRSFSESEGRQFNSLTLPAEKTKNDSINSGINGLLPWGTTYDITTDFQHRYGSSGGFAGTNLLVAPEESFEADVGILVTQPLLRDFWTDALRREMKLLKREVKISEQNFRQTVMIVVRDVQTAYYELIAARDEVTVRARALELAERLLAENKRKVEVGVLAPLDERQAEAETAEARANLMLAQRAVLFRENSLRTLIIDDYQRWHALEIVPAEPLVAVPLTPQRMESWLRAMDYRPEIATLKLRIEQQGIEVSFRQNQLFPALDLQFGAGRSGRDSLTFDGTVYQKPSFPSTIDDIDDGRNPRWSIGAVFSVPLTSRRERYALRSAKESARQLEAQLRAVHQQILTEVENAITLVNSTFEQIEARRQTRLFREAALDAEQKKLENGKSTSFQVLELQNDLTAARSAEIRALAEYNKSLTEFYFSEGTILEKNQMKVE